MKLAPARWTFLTNHAHVLLALYRQPDLSLRHPLEAHHTVGELLEPLAPEGPAVIAASIRTL